MSQNQRSLYPLENICLSLFKIRFAGFQLDQLFRLPKFVKESLFLPHILLTNLKHFYLPYLYVQFFLSYIFCFDRQLVFIIATVCIYFITSCFHLFSHVLKSLFFVDCQLTIIIWFQVTLFTYTYTLHTCAPFPINCWIVITYKM